MASFDEIYVLNLHGSARRTSAATAGRRDEPVFEIQQGTAIILAVKGSSGKKGVYYAEVVDPLDEKLAYLSGHDITTTTWTELNPSSPDYSFTRRATTLDAEYNSFISIAEIFGTGNRQTDKERLWATGFTSQQDEFAIAFTDEEMMNNINTLLRSRDVDEAKASFRLCSTDQWNYARAKRELARGQWERQIQDCAFRPFDNRRTIFNRNVVSILRDAVMRHLRLGCNLALLTSRVVNDATYAHVFVSRQPADKIFLSAKTSTNAYVFPLYLYEQAPLEAHIGGGPTRRPNLSRRWIAEFASRLNLNFVTEGRGEPPNSFGPEDVFEYIYAVLHSPTYRQRYQESLRGDFPRIPMPTDRETFFRLAVLGQELVSIHLFESPVLDVCTNPFTSPIGFPERGDDVVEPGYPKYVAPGDVDPFSHEPVVRGRVYISGRRRNSDQPVQFFDGIAPEIWEFRIGGYRVCEKWLKDRRRRQLSENDLVHYQKIVVAVRETIRVMRDIDLVLAGERPAAS